MRSRPVTLATAALTACTALLFTVQPASSTPTSTPAARAMTSAPAEHHAGRHGCVPEGETGLYLSKEGEAKLSFAPEFRKALAQQKISTEAVAPHTLVDGGTAVHIPIGEKYDNIELPSGRVCYPGGMKWANPSTGATYKVDDFWILFAAFGQSKVFTTPEINGVPRAGGELNLADFTVRQALTTGQFVPHNGGIGPKRVTFTIDDEFAEDLNTTLGTDIKRGTPWATLDIAWKGAPTRALPPMNTPELAGLRLMNEAIQRGSAPSGPLSNPFPSAT